MNQAKLAKRVVAALEPRAQADRLAWTSTDQVAAEVFEALPTPAQANVLRKVLFRLAADRVIEVGEFNRGTRLTTPRGEPSQSYTAIASGTSGGLAKENTEYGVRLRDGAEDRPRIDT
jgi:hypothetical protein